MTQGARSLRARAAGLVAVTVLAVSLLTGVSVGGARVAAAQAAPVPYGDVNELQVTPSGLFGRGWTIDDDAPTTPLVVHVYDGDQFIGAFPADQSRPDVGAAYPHAGADHGYSFLIPLAAGQRTVCVYAINVGAGGVVVPRGYEPYARALDTVANLDTLIGYSPTGISRTAVGGGDSPMGNLVATAMWRRLGVQTDLSITNSLGIRDSIPPGPVAIDQVFNVFPFENSITTMLVSGREVREMLDFVARRSTGRGCNSQAQIAGAHVVITCGGCDRNGDGVEDTVETTPGVFSTFSACAETINIGLARTVIGGTPTGVPTRCDSDLDCYTPTTHPEDRSLCEPVAHACMQPLSLNSSYALAANDFIAAGGSGFFVLQRNTTQVNTGVQLRDAVIDFVQAREPCGYNATTAQALPGGASERARARRRRIADVSDRRRLLRGNEP